MFSSILILIRVRCYFSIQLLFRASISFTECTVHTHVTLLHTHAWRERKRFGLILSYHPSFSVCLSCAQMFRISVSISQNILYRFVFVSNKDFMMDQINSVLVTFLMQSSRCEMRAPPIPYNAYVRILLFLLHRYSRAKVIHKFSYNNI